MQQNQSCIGKTTFQMDIFANSWFVLVNEWNSILGMLGIFLLGSGIVFLCLKTIFDDSLTFGEFFVLGMGGAFLPIFLGIFLSWIFKLLFGIKISFGLFCLIIFTVCCFAVSQSKGIPIQKLAKRFYSRVIAQFKNAEDKQPISAILTLRPKVLPALALILIFIGSVYLRLAFISGLIAPLHFDSALHYSMVKNLVTNFEASTVPVSNLFSGEYYHLGFHFLVAAISLALHLDIKNATLIFGQIALAILPLPMFFIVRQETKLDAAAIFATLLAGWGWSMPAYAVNWGKYPALTSLIPFGFVLCSLYLVLRSPQRSRWVLIGVLGLSILASTFIHTRSFVLIIIAFISLAIAIGRRRLPRLLQTLVFCLAICGLLTLIFIIQSKPVLNLAFARYQAGGLWMLLLVLLLLPFALKEFPVATFSNIFALILLLGSLFVSVASFIPAKNVQMLLDRPFVELILFFPLAFLGGLGYAGMLKTVNNSHALKGMSQKWAHGLIALLLFGMILINFKQYNFFPSTCCKYFEKDDAVAIDWMDKNIPPNATVMISLAASVAFESAQTIEYAYSDGGIWITPLIQRAIEPLPYQTDFSAQSTWDELCMGKITYIYVGGSERSFDTKLLKNRPDWYETLLFLPKAQVYKVVNCR
jgi:hypothetical protein